MTSPSYPMRSTCSQCGCDAGRLETRGGQDCVFCLGCGRHCYNAPRVETGRDARSLRTRPDIKPSQRARVLERDNGQCVLCHSNTRDLDVGHVISVKEGRALGMTDAELYSDDNLVAMCAPCNSGLGQLSLNPRILLASMRARGAR